MFSERQEQPSSHVEVHDDLFLPKETMHFSKIMQTFYDLLV